MAEETSYLDRLRSYLGITKPPETPKKLTTSEQQAVDRAVPRRFESTVKSSTTNTDKNLMPSLSRRKPVKPVAQLAPTENNVSRQRVPVHVPRKSR